MHTTLRTAAATWRSGDTGQAPSAPKAFAAHGPMAPAYLDALRLIERLDALALELVRYELDRRGEREINAVQAQLLFNIGDRQMTAGDLRARGCYLGTNVSYNLKKLVEKGFIHQQRRADDHRSVLVRLTAKGERVRDALLHLFERHLGALEPVGGIAHSELLALDHALARLERFWTDQIRYRL